MREIKFRFWQIHEKDMNEPLDLEDGFNGGMGSPYSYVKEDCIAMQYTGLKDKNGDGGREVYECDIIDEEGYVIGNTHQNGEIYKEETHLIIPAITSKEWRSAYEEAMARGCRHA